METITRQYKVYQFKELSEAAQDAAIESLADVNIDHDWYDYIQDEAKQLGLDIDEFDTYHSTIKGKFTDDATNVANKIMDEHGKDTETYKDAARYVKDHDAIGDDDTGYAFDELDNQFEATLLEDYLILLRQEYGYLTTRAAIIETIEANEYQFTEDGKLFS